MTPRIHFLFSGDELGFTPSIGVEDEHPEIMRPSPSLAVARQRTAILAATLALGVADELPAQTIGVDDSDPFDYGVVVEPTPTIVIWGSGDFVPVPDDNQEPPPVWVVPERTVFSHPWGEADEVPGVTPTIPVGDDQGPVLWSEPERTLFGVWTEPEEIVPAPVTPLVEEGHVVLPHPAKPVHFDPFWDEDAWVPDVPASPFFLEDDGEWPRVVVADGLPAALAALWTLSDDVLAPVPTEPGAVLDKPMRGLARTLHQAFGKSATITYVGSSTFDPATGDVTRVVTTQTLRAIVFDHEENGAPLQMGTLRVTFAAIKLDTEPKIGDTVAVGSTVYEVIDAKVLWSGAKKAVWFLRVRR